MNFTGKKYHLLENPEDRKKISSLIKKDLKDELGKDWKFNVYERFFEDIVIEFKQVPESIFKEGQEKSLNIFTMKEHEDILKKIGDIGNAYRKEEDREKWSCKSPKKNYSLIFSFLNKIKIKEAK